ncbi:hypothetical protein STEG23_008784 [Scotinomys teguina]
MLCSGELCPGLFVLAFKTMRMKRMRASLEAGFLQASRALSYNPTDCQHFRTKTQAQEDCLRIQGKTKSPDSTHNSQLISVPSNSDSSLSSTQQYLENWLIYNQLGDQGLKLMRRIPPHLVLPGPEDTNLSLHTCAANATQCTTAVFLENFCFENIKRETLTQWTLKNQYFPGNPILGEERDSAALVPDASQRRIRGHGSSRLMIIRPNSPLDTEDHPPSVDGIEDTLNHS